MKEFEHLVLLIGTNPLPNFVVAEHFLKAMTIKKIYLVHSEKTKFYQGTLEEAERLEEVLKARYPERKALFPLEKISLSDISRANVIKTKIQDKLINSLPQACAVHLNYTGGTKAMGIHVYAVLKESKSIKDTSFSYLDSRIFRIVDDDEGDVTDDLRGNIAITFEEIIKLHGLSRVNKDKDKDTSAFENTLNFFTGLVEESRLDKYFDDYNRKLFENKNGNLVDKTKDLKEETKNARIKGLFLNAMKTIPQSRRLFDDDGNYIEPEGKKIKSTLEYLDGKWLEDYVYYALTEGREKLRFYKDWEMRKPHWLEQSKFQIDVIALKGYQLIGISCTTSSFLPLCKSKGFEVLLRTRQIGGDEAKAVLITRLAIDNAVILQDSLRADTAGVDNILVLGKEDIKKNILEKKFYDFINN